MQEANNRIEMNFLNRDCDVKKDDAIVKPKRKPVEKSALKSANKSTAKAPVQRVKIAPYAYVEVSFIIFHIEFKYLFFLLIFYLC